jgi:hypothetical protein
MIRDAQEIKSLALKYSKPQLAHMAQIGMIDTQKAVLAAMMRDRIAKEDAKPPTTTVAQDVMGVQPQQIAPVSEPPQMGMAQAPAPVMPEQMAATGGLTSIPYQEQDYAGGGIVAFADGGIPRYNGNPEDGSQVMYDNAKVTDAGGFRFPSGSLLGMFERRQSSGADALEELQNLDAQIAKTPPGPARNRMLQTRQFVASKASAANTQSFAPPNQPTGVAALNATNVSGTSTPSTFPAPVADAAAATNAPPSQPKIGGPKMPAIPSLPPIGNVRERAVEEYKMPEKEDIKTALGRQEEADKAAGVDTGIFEKLRGEYEGKKGKLGERKQEAIGMAIMQTGLGLMGASRGRELASLGDSGQKALAGLVASNEKIRDYEDKLEDKQRDLLLAQNDYNRTRSKSALDRVNKIEDRRNELEVKTVDAKNKRMEHEETIASQTRGQDITARGQDLSYRAHMAQISQMARPGETERLMSQYQELYKKDPAAAAKWLENLGTIRGIGKPQNTFSFEEAMKIVAAKPQNINATPDQLAQQARALMSAGMQPGGAAGPRVGGAVDTSNPLLR